jgi:fibronectin-binding autotransporter adhesin
MGRGEYSAAHGLTGTFSMKSTYRSAWLLPATAASFVALVLVASLPIRADVYWTLPAGQSGDWSVAANWGGILPTGTDAVYIVNGGTTNISLPGEVCNSLTLGGTGSSTIRMTAGQLTAKINGSSGGAENIGSSGKGTFTQSGGTNTTSGGLFLGLNAGGSGTYNLNGGMLNVSGLGGGSGTAVFNFSGGTLRAGSGFLTTMKLTLGTSGGGATFDTAGKTVTLSGPLSGPGSLTKIGSGILTLSGSSTYTGSTTISGGTLQLGTGVAGKDGSVTGAIVNNSALVYNLYGNQTIGYAVSGAGSVTKAGTSALAINAYWANTGQVNVNGGTLAFAKQDIWTTAIGYPGVVLNLNAGSTVTSNGYFNMLNSLVLNGGTLAGNGGNSTAWGAFGLEGTVTVGGTSASYISPAPGGPYNYNFIDLGNQNVSTTTFNVAHVTGNAGPDLIVSLPMVSSGNAFSGAFNLVKTGAGTMLLTASNTYTGSTTIGAGTLQLGTGAAGRDGSVTGAIINNSALVFNLNGNQTVGYAVSGAGNVTKAGSGMLTLTGVNTFSGTTTISAGTLEAIKAASLPRYGTAGKVTIAGGAVLAVQVGDGVTGWNSPQIDSLRTGATWTDNTACLGIDTTNANFTYGSNITQSLALTKFGNNTLTLAGVNTYTGDTTISSGILNLGDPLAAQNSTINVSAGGALWFAAGITSPALGGLTGAGSVALRTSASLPVTLNVGRNGRSTTYSGGLSGAGGLTKLGAGILTLTASESYSGPTIINGGMLRLRGVPSVPAGATAIYTFDNASGSLVPNAVNRGTYDGTLQNGAAIISFPGAPSGYVLSLGAQGGNTYLQVAGANNTGIPTSTGTYTASSWFYGLYGPGTWRTLFRGADASGVTGDHPVIIDTGSSNLGFYDNVTGSGFNGSGYSMAGYNGATVWHQFTVVANGGTSTYYIDGQAVGTVPRASTTGIFAIGNFQGGGQDFSQYLDDVYVYNGTALNAAGVMQLYNATSGRAASSVLPMTTALSIAAGATLDLGGGSQQVASLSDYGPGSGGSIINSSTGSASVLTLSPGGGTTTFSGLIAGGGGNGPISLVKASAGTQILAGANTYAGSTKISGGMLQLGNQAAIPDNSALTITAGTLDLGGFTKTTSAAVSLQGGVVQNGVLVNNGPAYDGGAGTVSASLQGGAGLSKTAGGTLTLAANNSYSGLTAINSGTLNLAHPLAVQNSTIRVSPSGVLVFAAGNTNPVLGGLAGVGKVVLATTAAELVTLSVGQNGQNSTFSGSLSGAGGFTKQGGGTLTLTSPQGYNGPTVIEGGLLQLQPAVGGSIGIHFQGNNNSMVTGSAGVVAMSNWNNLTGSSFTSAALTDNSGLTTTANLTIYAAGLRNSGSSNPLLNGYIENDNYNRLTATIRGIPYSNYSLYAYMADFNTNATGEKVTVGVATYYFNAINSADYDQVTNTNSGKHPKGNYVVATGLAGDTQTVTVQGDTQQYGGFTGFEIVNTAVGGVNLLPGASSLTIGNSATLDLGGTSQLVATLSDYGPAKGGKVINSNAAVASVLTLSPTGGSTTFSGAVQGGAALGAISLLMNGSGTQVLAGSNTFTGDTTINSGRLAVDGWLASPASVNGGTLSGTGTLSSATVNAGGILAPGDSLGVLHLSGNLVLAASAKLWYELDTPSTSDMISMPFGNVTLNGQRFSDFDFTPSASFGPGSYTLIDFGSRTGSLGANTSGLVGVYPAALSISGSSLVLNVVPEPSTAALLGAGVLGLFGWTWRRRRS